MADSELLDNLLEFLLEHRLQPLAADITLGLSIQRVAHAHVIRRDCLRHRPGRPADGEKPSRHFLPAADLGKSSVGARVEIEFQRLVPCVRG